MVGRQRLAVLATCNLDQWAMDFEGNLRRITRSIAEARRRGATYRVGSALPAGRSMYSFALHAAGVVTGQGYRVA